MQSRAAQGRGAANKAVKGRALGILGTMAIALLGLIFLAVIAQTARAAAISDGEELRRFGGAGSAAGQLDLPWGLASDSTTGHLFVVDEGSSSRVSEFTPWGDFVKAFGWDVAPGAVNEQQEVRVRAAAGQFRLSFGAQTTANLPFNASAAEVEAALQGLLAIGAGGASVESVPGTTSGVTPFVYVITFKGLLVATDVAQLVAINGTTALSGGVPLTSLEVNTRADGHAPSTGLESCTQESGCKSGLEGGGAGQLASFSRGIAIDGGGNLYVKEVANRRVQKFDSAGRFVLMFGAKVNKTKVEAAAPTAEQNICPVDPADVCQAGVAGTGDGEFGPGLSGGVALCSGSLFVADSNRIQRFNLEGEFQLPALPEPGKTVQRLACDLAGGGLYATFEPESDVHKIDSSTGEEVDSVEVPGVYAIATDLTGNLFATSGSKVLEFNAVGNPLAPPSCCEASLAGLNGLGTNTAGDLYVAYANAGGDSFIRAFGPGPVAFESPPPVPPEITAQFASSVQRDGATVAADVNPHFFTDTHYFVQYGTGECRAGGCENEVPLPPGQLLTTKAVNGAVRSAGIFLGGLQPGTTYHYRFVAESAGGGPVYGIDPDGEGAEGATPEKGKEGTFLTFPSPTPTRACANDVVRLGPATRLPDCRAYEMVSPVDKNNGDIATLLDFSSYPTGLNQSATNGGGFAYSSYRGFANPKSAPYTNQYRATRNPVTGWSSEALEVAQVSHQEFNSFENHLKAFTPDLCAGLLMVSAEPVAALGASEGYRNVYRRDNCGGGGYEALIQTEPTLNKEEFVPIVQGVSTDGKASIFIVRDQLTSEAAGGGDWQAYYARGGQLHLLCVLPNGGPSGANCSAGASNMGGAPAPSGLAQAERLSSVTRALSGDGSKAYWTDSGSVEDGPGQVYLRLNPGEEQSALEGGVCTEPEKACTVKVSGTKTTATQDSLFLGASADGSKALFLVKEGPLAENLYLFDSETESSTLVASKVLGVAGASEDFSRVYLVSKEAIAGTTGAAAGKPNLYLAETGEGGEDTFIATISATDAIFRAPSDATSEAIFHAARASADGRVLTFVSSLSLTGYDNTDLTTGKGDMEVYLYELGAEKPVCVSCNPSGARPAGRFVVKPYFPGGVQIAAWPTLPENALYSPRVLSADGRRLLFNSFDALLPRDTNGKQDVYQWQSAQSQAACAEKGAELYVASAAGCISLISTGESPQDSEMLDASVNGDDAFFITNASLLPRDPGLFDVYDARANGGIAEPPPPPSPCQGETCQPAVAAPSEQTPSSSTYVGPEDEQKKAKSKKKGKQKKKGKHKKQHKKKSNQRKQGGQR